jgi:diaminopimelate decarboxylase
MSLPRHAERRFFQARGAELLVGDVPVSALAEQVGTPFYAYSGAAMRARVGELRAALPERIKLHYAIKANPMAEVVRFMSPLVDGLDVASGRELQVALDAGMRPHDISFAGPGKSVAELEQAVAAGILLNLESFREIALLEGIQQRVGKPARVAVRVNPDFELKSSGMKMGGGPKQFGIDAEMVPQALQQIGARGLAFEGFHIFSGSQNLKAASICEALSKGLELATRLADAAPLPVQVLNLGGGFGIPYFPGEMPLDLPTIGTHLREICAQAEERLPRAELVIELGRFLVGEAGVYVCRVLDRKVSRGEVFLVTDGGLHHHLAASGNFGQVIRKNYPVTVATRMDEQETECASVVGPLCTPLDLLGERMHLARADAGDLIAVLQSGAYGFTASPLGFLSHPPPTEVFV